MPKSRKSEGIALAHQSEEMVIAHQKDNETAKENEFSVSFKLENYLPDDLQTHYSDAMTVLHTENEFILSFMQTQFPLAGTKEELEAIPLVRRKCFARIIVSPKQMEAIINSMQDNMDKFRAAYRKPEGGQ